MNVFKADATALESPLPVLPLDMIDAVTDIAFIEPEACDAPTDLREAIAYTGLRTGYRLVDLSDLDSEENLERLAWFWNFYKHLRAEVKDDARLFRFEHDGRVYRCKRRSLPNGMRRLTMRHIPKQGPRLEDLQHPTYWHDLMMMPSLLRGGLVIICAPTGNGKTTTLAGMWDSRLRKYGGVGVTVEEPIEIDLGGCHGQGMCVQTEVDLSLPKDARYPAALEDILTEFPTLASGGGMLLIAELRDAQPAKESLMYAQTGILVAATVHANTPEDAVQRVVTLATPAMGSEKAARELVASTLRLVVQQQLALDPQGKGWKRGTYTGNILFSQDASSKAAGVIRDQPISALNEIVAQQNARLKELQKNKASFPQVLAALDGDPASLEL